MISDSTHVFGVDIRKYLYWTFGVCCTWGNGDNLKSDIWNVQYPNLIKIFYLNNFMLISTVYLNSLKIRRYPNLTNMIFESVSGIQIFRWYILNELEFRIGYPNI